MRCPGIGSNGIMYKYDGKLHLGSEKGKKYADKFGQGDIMGLELDMNNFI